MTISTLMITGREASTSVEFRLFEAPGCSRTKFAHHFQEDPPVMRFLCISDIHGNAHALQKILREGEARGFDQLIVCGDICFPGSEPLEVWRTLVKYNALCVQGVGDRALATVQADALKAKTPEGNARIQRLQEVRTELGELIINRLKKLPPFAHLPLESGHTMLVVHGSPGDPMESLSRDMTEEELVARLGDESGDIVICGSSHEQFEGTVADVHIVSVGSVGEAPGGTHALGAIVDSTQAGFSATLFSVPLDDNAEEIQSEVVAQSVDTSSDPSIY